METHSENHHSRSVGDSGNPRCNRVCGITRTITLIVIHCTATREDVDFTQKDLLRCHRAQGMKMVGYHFYIRKDGFIWTTRPMDMIGAHARGFNEQSIGIAYEGGLNPQGRPSDTRTRQQKHSMRVLIRTLKKDFPNARYTLEPTGALCSFYAEEGGLMIAMEGAFNQVNNVNDI